MYIDKSKERSILPYLIVFPMATHWILPDGLEQKLYVSFLGVPLYIFDICYIVYIIKYPKANMRNYQNSSFVRRISLLSVLYLIYSFLNGLANEVDGLLLHMIDNQAFIYCALIFLLFPLNKIQAEKTIHILLPTTIILCVEIFVFSLGLAAYSVELSSENFGGIMRISTTIGAATASAYVISCLGVVCISAYQISERLRFLILIMVSITLLMLMSRTALILWVIYVTCYIYKSYLRHSSLKRKIGTIIIALGSLYAMYSYGTFDAMIERQENSKSSGDLSSGREELIEKSFRIFRSSGGSGIGVGQTNIDKSLNNIVKPSHPCGVHNFYIGQLSEEGVVGLIIVIFLLFYLIQNLDYKKTISYFVILQIFLAFQTEPIYIQFEFVSVFFFIAMLSTKRTDFYKNEYSSIVYYKPRP